MLLSNRTLERLIKRDFDRIDITHSYYPGDEKIYFAEKNRKSVALDDKGSIFAIVPTVIPLLEYKRGQKWNKVWECRFGFNALAILNRLTQHRLAAEEYSSRQLDQFYTDKAKELSNLIDVYDGQRSIA